jgi:hypothetical protein
VEPWNAVPITLELLAADATATGDAVLQNDFDEARFRMYLLRLKADVLGLPGLSAATATLRTALGPVGSAPATGYGADLLRVADELESIGCSL